MAIDGRFCGLIAADFLGPAAKKGEPLHPQNYEGFDTVRWALFRSGLLVAAPGTQACEGRYVLAAGAADMADIAADTISVDKAEKSQLLEAIVNFHCCYLELPITRRWFQVSERSAGLMATMAEYGYAVRIHDRYRWTDRIAAAMRAAYLWDAENRCLAEARLLMAEERITKMWEQAPATVRTRLLSHEETILDLGRMIALMWDDENQCWGEPRLDELGELRCAAQSLWLARNMRHYIATGSILSE